MTVLIEAEKATLVISFRHHFPVPHSVDRAGSQPTEQQNQSTMWVLKTTFSLMTVMGWLQALTESTLCVLPTCVSNHGLRLFLSLRTDGGLWNQYIPLFKCVRLWGSASLWFFALQCICNYQHMAQTLDLLFFRLLGSALLHICTFIMYRSVASDLWENTLLSA